MKRLFLALPFFALPVLCFADEPPADYLSNHPSCFIYKSDDGQQHALVQGAVQGMAITGGLVQELLDSTGHRYSVPVEGRRYELDVPIHGDVRYFQEGNLTRHGFPLHVVRFRAWCRGNAVVNTGPLEIKKNQSFWDSRP